MLLRSKKSTLPDDELAGFPVESDIKTALKHKPDAVIVSNPTSMHLDVALPAAEAGCAIFLEKPVSDSMERLSELQRAVSNNSAKVLVGYQYRFHPTLSKIPALLKEGRIGKVVSVKSHWGEYLPDWHPWENFRESYAAKKDLGGGVVLTLCHPFDYLIWLFGKPELLWSRTDTLSGWGLDVEDNAEIALKFPNDAIGSMHLDYIQRPPSHSLQITGSEGTINWNNADGRLSCFSAGTASRNDIMPAEGFERNSMFVDLMRHFVEVAKGAQAPVCGLNDGVASLDLALKVLKRS